MISYFSVISCSKVCSVFLLFSLVTSGSAPPLLVSTMKNEGLMTTTKYPRFVNSDIPSPSSTTTTTVPSQYWLNGHGESNTSGIVQQRPAGNLKFFQVHNPENLLGNKKAGMLYYTSSESESFASTKPQNSISGKSETSTIAHGLAGIMRSESPSPIMMGLTFTPEEIAQYIFLTGDEGGVASTLDDLINYDSEDGTIKLKFSEDSSSTISFLQNVKTRLTELRGKYQEYLFLENFSG